MNKFYSFLAAAALTVSFTACEDVPAPYGIGEDSGAVTPQPGEDGVIFEADFATDFGGFTNFTTSGEGGWKIDFKTAKASGYDPANKVNTAGVYYLVSPELSLEGQKEAHLTYEYIQAYSNRYADGDKVMISAGVFDPAKADQNWTEIPVNFKEPNKTEDGKLDWKTFHTMDIQIPAEYMGKKIRIAFYHACDEKGSTTMEIKNLKLLSGKAEGGEEVKPDVPAGVKQLPYAEALTSDMGAFKNYTTSGTGNWEMDGRGFAKASGFTAKDQPANPGTYYMVSPEISLAGKTAAHVTYEYLASFSYDPKNEQFMINANFNESNPAEGWVSLKADHEKSSSWTDWKTADVTIPAEYMGKNVRVAFYYNCGEKASTFEIKNFLAEESNGGVTPPAGDALFGASFKEGLDGCVSVLGTDEWQWEYDSKFTCVKVSGHVGGKEGHKTPGVAYLVTPEISLVGQTEAHLSYRYAIGYWSLPEYHQVLINDNYNEANPSEGWTNLNVNHQFEDKKFTWFDADVQLPANMMGKKVRIAFRYECNAEKASTWELNDLKVLAGKGGNEGGEGGETPQPGEGDTGDVNALNGDFECWVGGLPNNWNGTGGNARLHQSTDAHSGKYSVEVEGYSGANKRLGYKDMDLKAGSYTIKAYMKSAEGATARFGYVPVPASGGSDYKYGDYINNIPNTWTEYTYTFDIPADGKYNILIMNGKKPGKNFLIDDVTLTSADGTVIIK